MMDLIRQSAQVLRIIPHMTQELTEFLNLRAGPERFLGRKVINVYIVKERTH